MIELRRKRREADAAAVDRAGDRWVLILIGGGIILSVNFIVFVIWRTAIGEKPLPDMAEVIFGAIIGGALVKLADVLSALVTLATGRQIEKQSDQLADAMPQQRPKLLPAPGSGAGAGAEAAAEAAEEEAARIQQAEEEAELQLRNQDRER